VRNSSIVGIVLCFLTLLIELGILAGLVTTRVQATALLLGWVGLGFVGWLRVAVKILFRAPGRASIAAALERADGRFQDRLNTLLFLESPSARADSVRFRKLIADQAGRVMAQQPPRLPFSSRSPLALLGTLALMLAGLLWLNQQYALWRRLPSGAPPDVSRLKGPAPELTLPASNAVETTPNWGEVRITEPGRDLKVTKVDVVPLSIEVAANEDLQGVQWCSSVNGGEEKKHELTNPKEPRYASYEPTIYLDELGLSDWDVLTYYAKAETVHHQAYASDIYFIEVRPFREDIAKIPGGAGGRAYQTLNDISSLVGFQQQAIRDTHEFAQKAPTQEQIRNQTRLGLARSEADLGTAAQHLYADMAATMENKPIGAALDNLAQAETSLNQASGWLKDNVMDQAQSQERAALAQLVAARKIFQKAVSDHPGEFDPSQPGDPAPVANSSQKLNEMAEFRDEARSAEEFVQKTLEQQKEVEHQAAAPLQGGEALAGQEQRLARQLKDFTGEHPNAFKGSESQTAQAQASLQHAEEHLRSSAPDSAARTRQATQGLEKLRAAVQNHGAGEQLADAYRLKRMLEEQARLLGQMAQPEAKGSAQDMESAACEAQAILARLKQTLEQASAGAGWGKPLSESLTEPNRSAAEEALSKLLQAQSDDERREQARAAQSALAQIGRAFDRSQPKPLQQARQNDLLQPDAEAGFAQGLNQLQRLLKQFERAPGVVSAEQARQSRQALENLQAGLRDQAGQDSTSSDLMAEVGRVLGAGQEPDPVRLKRLLEQLGRFATERSLKPTGRSATTAVANIDATRLPQAYRGRIERYFEKLSEE
jgi:hypothetical protein